MTELKLCPFCNSNTVGARVTRYDTQLRQPFHQVRCQGCKACGPEVMSEEEAIRLWNIRAEGSLAN